MNVEIKSLHSDEGTAHLLSALPVLRQLPDDAAVHALKELYDLGVKDGAEGAAGVLNEMSELLAHLVVAYRRGDGAKVADLLEEFSRSRCIVREAGTPTH